jgi:uncharacterized protein
MNKTSLLPRTDRIASLDVLRGIAVLGILIINMQSFSMINAAYINPAAYGDLSGINKNIWILSHVLADQKFLSLFSMLFGAGIVLFAQNVEDRGFLPARFYYRRLFWLFTIGLLHGYIFWHGDILVAYAVCGALAFIFRKLSPVVLIAIGLIIFSVPSFNYWLFGKSMEMWPPEAIAGIRESWSPTQEVIDREIAALTGGIIAQLKWRIPETFKMETFIFLIFIGWRALACMLIGMGLFKFGFFNLAFSRKSYLYIAVAMMASGFTLIITGVTKNFEVGWAVEYSMFFGWQWNYIGSLFVALGYSALVMLLVESFNLNLLARVGRMAFTNYLFTTFICTGIFYGHGLGLFGQAERWQQMVLTVAVWLVLIIFSWLWLQRFRFGPVEWLWRYLTYGNKPEFKRELRHKI